MPVWVGETGSEIRLNVVKLAQIGSHLKRNGFGTNLPAVTTPMQNPALP